MMIINEVYPNPSEGSEWIELFISEQDSFSSEDLLGFSLSDDYHPIYQFNGEENFFEQFLLVLVTGLNNAGDQVILKDKSGSIIDEMSYSSSKKGLSWSRSIDNQFVLTDPSPLATNPSISPSPSVSTSLTPTPSIEPNPSPTISPSASQNLNPGSDSNANPASNNPSNQKEAKQTRSAPTFSIQLNFPNYQNPQDWQYQQQKESTEARLSRLQFLGQKILKKSLKDAIIGSSLLIVSAILFSYEYKKPSKTVF